MYSLAYLTLPGVDPVNQIKIAKESGYDCVGLRPIPLGLPNEPRFVLHEDRKLFEATKFALQEYDIKLWDIELARIRHDLDIKSYEPAMEEAAALGAKNVLSSIWTRDKVYYTEQTGRLAEMAAKYGMNINVEFLPWAGLRNLQEAITLLDSLQKDNLYIMLDTLHAGRAGVTAAEIKRANPNYFQYIHLCDGPAGPDGDAVLDDIKDELMLFTAREGRLYPGEGIMDIAGMVKALPSIPVSIELPNLKRLNEIGMEGHAKRCFETTKEYFIANNIDP